MLIHATVKVIISPLAVAFDMNAVKGVVLAHRKVIASALPNIAVLLAISAM
jgi:hypothetical protein